MWFGRTTSVAAILILLCGLPLLADSLWAPTSNGLFADVKARQVGDLVTIIVVEEASSSLTATSDFDKSLQHSSQAGVGPLLSLVPEFSFSSSQKGASGGATTMTSKLDAKLTAAVTKVLPNGNLEIKGQRAMITNREKQEMTLTGTVRPQDIATDNTVLSTYLSDVEVKCTGKGPAGDRQKEGIISKLIKFIF
jgi:flagellar L-ring protein precursor FlgH